MELKKIDEFLTIARRYFENGDFKAAQQILLKIVKQEPKNADANELLAYIYGNQGEADRSLEFLKIACSQNTCSAEALYYLGNNYLKRDSYHLAIKYLQISLIKAGGFFEGLHDLGTAYVHLGDSKKALQYFMLSTEINEDSYEPYFNIARIYHDLKHYEEALNFYNKAILLKPDISGIWLNRGTVLNDLRKYDAALADFDKAIQINPNYAEAWSNKGVTLHEQKKFSEALLQFDKAIQINPNYAEAWSNKGITLNEQKKHSEALIHFNKALQINPKYAIAWLNKGVALSNLNNSVDALESFNNAISLKSDYPEAWLNKGVILSRNKKFQDALNCFNKAISLRINYPKALACKGLTLNQLKLHQEAIENFEKALSLNEDLDFILGEMIHTKMKICDWSLLDQSINLCISKINNKELPIQPLHLLSIIDAPEIHKNYAKFYSEAQFTNNISHDFTNFKKNLGGKIKIAYFSSDLRDHPVGQLISELFEKHNQNAFEIFCFYFGPKVIDGYQQRIKNSIKNFYEVGDLSEAEISKKSREMGIHIAINLNGFTSNSKTEIFSNRCAPIQINFLGYPGTLGGNYSDYIIADKTVIPEKFQDYYHEKIIYLPNSFQVNDSTKKVTKKIITRDEHNLPNDYFVFCCLNNLYKITPKVFKIWLEILKNTKKSVLWLPADNSSGTENLKNEAKNFGVDSDRVIFTNRASNHEDYLRKYQLADLFLDTFPYNGHTTASDALWSGLPVLTYSGKSFASRVASSLLKTLDLSELITDNLEEYKFTAISLAQNPSKLKKIKNKLEINKTLSPLFNTQLYASNLESAFKIIYNRFQEGIPPDHIEL